MRVFEHRRRLWIDHDQPGDPYHRHGPQPTNVAVGPPREAKDRALYQSVLDLVAAIDAGAGDAMLDCKRRRT